MCPSARRWTLMNIEHEHEQKQERTSVQPSIVMHWKTVSIANPMLHATQR